LLFLIIGNCAGGILSAVQAQTDEKVVAVVNGRRITHQDVDHSIVSKVFPLQQQIYALRKTALENFIIRTILEDEARRKGISVEELRKQLTGGKTEVPPGEVEQIYLENAATFAAMSPDEAKERIRLDLETQARMQNYRAALSKLKENSGVQILLAEPKLPSVEVGTVAPSAGAQAAHVTITEFANFQCVYCKQAQSVIKQVLRSYGNDVRLVFKHLPLDTNSPAFAASRAAFCAGEQGSFWQYHDGLFASESLSPETFTRTAKGLGLDLTKFKACAASEASRAAVLKDVQEATRLGINGTPAFIINGMLVRGAPDFEEFKSIIERELKSSQMSLRQQ
jgi:protein-disulfide isomerase